MDNPDHEGEVGRLKVRKPTESDIYKIPERFKNDKYLQNLPKPRAGD